MVSNGIVIRQDNYIICFISQVIGLSVRLNLKSIVSLTDFLKFSPLFSKVFPIHNFQRLF